MWSFWRSAVIKGSYHRPNCQLKSMPCDTVLRHVSSWANAADGKHKSFSCHYQTYHKCDPRMVHLGKDWSQAAYPMHRSGICSQRCIRAHGLVDLAIGGGMVCIRLVACWLISDDLLVSAIEYNLEPGWPGKRYPAATKHVESDGKGESSDCSDSRLALEWLRS